MITELKTLDIQGECEWGQGCCFLQPFAFRQHMYDGSYVTFLFSQVFLRWISVIVHKCQPHLPSFSFSNTPCTLHLGIFTLTVSSPWKTPDQET